MRTFIIKLLSLLFIFLFPQNSDAFSEIPGLFIDEGVGTLARGGMKRLPENQETLDFNSPLFLDSYGKIKTEVVYEHQRTIKEFNGNWAGSHAYSERQETAVAAPYSLFGGKLVGSIAAGYGNVSYDVDASSTREDVFISASEQFYTVKGGLFLKALDKVSLGLSVIDTDHRNHPDIPIEINIEPVEYLSIGYKRSFTDITWKFSGFISGSKLTFPVVSAEEQHELILKGVYKKIIIAQYAQNIQHPENNRFTGRVELPGQMYFVGEYTRHIFELNEDFFVNSVSGGNLKGGGAWRELRIGIGVDISSHWNIEANARHQNLESTGGGIANSSAVVGFWPSLIVGKYNHLYAVDLETDQYHLGAEYKGTNATFGMGCQYIDIKPVATMTYWRSLIFGLGKADQKTIQLDTDRIKLLLISLGGGYRWDMFSINVALGQFIPIATHERNTGANVPPSGGNGGGSNSFNNIWSDVKDFFNRNPGGNIVRLMASFYF